ncbi:MULTISPECIES: hypothetical protein [Mesorhizobium]|uniref:hypothetical protein n=1 Tax=Mesorhizobium TaxID=68287 RepID=UPI001FE8F93F|nr:MULTISPECIES: hypothetical protein [Mesorhizobium]
MHQFEDGDGRIHRYLIHHVLAMHRFNRREWCSRIGRDPGPDRRVQAYAGELLEAPSAIGRMGTDAAIQRPGAE